MLAPRLCATLLAILICLPSPGVAGKLPDGVEATTDRDWLVHRTKGNRYSESWTLIARSNSGQIMYLNFVYSNIGVFSGSATVNLSYSAPGEMAQHFKYDYTTKQYGEDAKTGRIGIGTNWMALKGRKLTVRLKEETVQVDLKVKGGSSGIKFADPRLTFGSDKKWADYFVHVPWGKVSGTVEVDGEKVDFKGHCYVDHWMQNVLATTYSSRWWTARFFHRDYSVAMVTLRTRPDFGDKLVRYLVVSDATRVLAYTTDFELTPSKLAEDPKGHKYHTRLEIKTPADVAGGIALDGAFSSKRLHDRDAIMETLNAAQRGIAKMVAGNPIVYRMEADSKLTLTVGGEKKQLSGTALIESVVFGD